MAHSIQVCRGRVQIFNDSDLIVIYMFLRETCCNSCDDQMRKFLADSEFGLRQFGPGLIHLDLDSVVEDQKFTQILVAALDEVLVRLNTFCMHIPSSFLNDRNITPGVIFYDYSVASLQEAVVRIKSLLECSRI